MENQLHVLPSYNSGDKMNHTNLGRVIILSISLFSAMVANADNIKRDDIVGQWRNVVENPSHKNTVSKRYMRHTFFDNGKLVVENKEDSESIKKWEFKNGIFIISSSYKSSKFIEHYKLVSFDELLKVKFKSIVDGKLLADYNPKEKYIRQGSATEKGMKIWDIFKSVSSSMDFIDPNTLKVGSKYTLSKKTPIMPHYTPSDLTKIIYAKKGHTITIIKRQKVNNTMWYQVKSSGNQGWINSIALFGQQLK